MVTALDALTREVTERMLNASAALPNAPTLPTLDPVALLRHVFELELRFNGGRPFPPRAGEPCRLTLAIAQEARS